MARLFCVTLKERLSLLTFALSASLFLSTAGACPYSVRQVGFAELKTEPYHVYVLVTDHTPGRERLAGRLKQAASIITDSNIQVEIVDVDRQETHDAVIDSYGLNIQRYPAAIMVSPKESAIILPGFQTGALSAKEVGNVLQTAVSSPKREELKSHIVKHWCVVMLVEGTDAARNQKARAEVKAAIKEVAGSIAQSGEIIDKPPYLLEVASVDPSEQVLLWSLGLGGETAQPRAVVLFGRGRQMGPVLEGGTLTKAGVADMVAGVGVICACTTDHRSLRSTGIPLRWEEDRQDQVRRLIGFDPDSPEVTMELARVWQEEPPASKSGLGLFGYTEARIEYVEEPGGNAAAGPPENKAPSAPSTVASSSAEVQAVSTLEENTGRMVIVVIAGMVAVVVAGSLILASRRRGA